MAKPGRRPVLDVDLSARLKLAGYTPGARDISGLVALLETDAPADPVIRALERVPSLAGVALASRLGAGSTSPALIRALGRMVRAGYADGTPLLAETATSASANVRTRREAIIALGKIGGAAAAAALCARWDHGVEDPAEKKALIEALGKVDSDHEGAAERLRGHDGDDSQTARVRERARLMVRRDQHRADASAIDPAVRLPQPWALLVRCRRGLEALLRDELSDVGIRARVLSPGRVLTSPTDHLGPTLGARIATSVALYLPLSAPNPVTIAEALASPIATTALRTLTAGPIRWRLGFADGRHRRSWVWQVAQAVTAAAPDLVNDPTQSGWHVVVSDAEAALELVPKAWPDPRFTYRVGDVPAASHPTVAAALVRASMPLATDNVWDPFCGSGTELVERALAGPAHSLLGSDLDATALATARANAEQAGVSERIALERGDALSLQPANISVILCNPPLGGRIRGDAGALLARFLRHAHSLLGQGGRLVWITPTPSRTDPVARALGYQCELSCAVDLGGLSAWMQRWRR